MRRRPTRAEGRRGRKIKKPVNLLMDLLLKLSFDLNLRREFGIKFKPCYQGSCPHFALKHLNENLLI